MILRNKHKGTGDMSAYLYENGTIPFLQFTFTMLQYCLLLEWCVDLPSNISVHTQQGE